MKSLRFLVVEPLEPLAISRSMIGGIRFYAPVSVSFPVPQPTTVLGVLGSLLGASVPSGISVNKLDDLKSVARYVRNNLRCGVPLMKGPFLAVKDSPVRLYIPVGGDIYVPAEYAERAIRRVEGAGDPFFYVDLSLCYEESGYCIVAESTTMVGVSLKRTGNMDEKVVRPGYMYKYPLVTYLDLKERKPVDACTVYVLNCEKGIGEAVARVGGEHRVALVRTVELSPNASGSVVSRVKNPLEDLEPGVYLAVSYVPIVPVSHNVITLDPSKLRGLEFLRISEGDSGQIVGIPPLLKHTSARLTRRAYISKIRVERLGLGYSEALGKRRPQVLALVPGTLVKLKRKASASSSSEIITTLWDIGYASLYKIQDA